MGMHVIQVFNKFHNLHPDSPLTMALFVDSSSAIAMMKKWKRLHENKTHSKESSRCQNSQDRWNYPTLEDPRTRQPSWHWNQEPGRSTLQLFPQSSTCWSSSLDLYQGGVLVFMRAVHVQTATCKCAAEVIQIRVTSVYTSTKWWRRQLATSRVARRSTSSIRVHHDGRQTYGES